MAGLADTAPAFVGLVRALKSGIDPRSILAPGKYGA
jgi:hypothetical protein